MYVFGLPGTRIHISCVVLDPAYSPGLARQPGPFEAGAGRSVRGLLIFLWEPPSPDDLMRGHQCYQ